MFLERLKLSIYSFLSDWLYVLAFAAIFFLMGATFGWQAIIGFQHNLQLNDVVTWYGRGNGNIQQYYLSTLIVYSALWLLGGVLILLAKWLYNRVLSRSTGSHGFQPVALTLSICSVSMLAQD